MKIERWAFGFLLMAVAAFAAIFGALLSGFVGAQALQIAVPAITAFVGFTAATLGKYWLDQRGEERRRAQRRKDLALVLLLEELQISAHLAALLEKLHFVMSDPELEDIDLIFIRDVLPEQIGPLKESTRDIGLLGDEAAAAVHSTRGAIENIRLFFSPAFGEERIVKSAGDALATRMVRAATSSLYAIGRLKVIAGDAAATLGEENVAHTQAAVDLFGDP